MKRARTEHRRRAVRAITAGDGSAPRSPVVHADRHVDRHALRAEMRRIANGLADVDLLTWYETGADGRTGLVDVDTVPLTGDMTAYLCGPVPFMRDVRAGLMRRGLPADRIRYEVFGPGMLDGRIG
ncbi:hypothetical protein AB0425_01725 [Actinosynnema sp. NPDC051121]